MADKFRVGIIGCGNIALRHIAAFLDSGRYEVSALADLSEEAMDACDERFEERDDYSPSHYTDATQMLDSEELDVVTVSVWHRGHAPWTIAAAARRPAAILCEKPMAENTGRAQEMMVACRRNDVKLVIGHQARFLPAHTMARELVAKGAIGDVVHATAPAVDGLLNRATHQLDTIRYVLGDVDCQWVMGNVERLTDRYERSTRIEDRAAGVFGFENGVHAQLLSDLTDDQNMGAVFYGSDGIINLYGGSLKLLNADTRGKWKEPQPPKGDWDGWETSDARSAQAAELADWIAGKVDTHRGEANHGYKAVEMVCALYESARVHERVTIPLQTRESPLDLMVESGHLPVRYPGRYEIRAATLRGENLASDEENT